MNGFEQSVYDTLTAKGHLVLRRGWPDFLVIDRGGRHGYGLELKQGSDRLSPDQRAMHEALGMWGLQVRTVRPEAVPSLMNKKGNLLDLVATRDRLKEQLTTLELAISTAGHQVNHLMHEVSAFEREIDDALIAFETPRTVIRHRLDVRQAPVNPTSWAPVLVTISDILASDMP